MVQFTKNFNSTVTKDQISYKLKDWIFCQVAEPSTVPTTPTDESEAQSSTDEVQPPKDAESSPSKKLSNSSRHKRKDSCGKIVMDAVVIQSQINRNQVLT
jgi:hypothetical protein